MRPQHRLALMFVVLMVLAIATGSLGDIYKWPWMSNWVAPALHFLYLTTLLTMASQAPPHRGPAWTWGRVTLISAPIWCFFNIEIDEATPVPMHLFGLSWTMTGPWASRLLAMGGFAIGALAVGLSWRDARRKLAAAPPTDPASAQPTPGATPTSTANVE